MLIYELPASSLKCRAHVIRRSFEPHDQMLYHRTILEPHTAYPIPAGTHYIVLTVQKTAFGLDIIPESLLPQLLQKGFHVGDFRKMKKFNQTPYKLPPPTPIHVPAEKRPLEEKALPKKRVRPVMRRVSRRSERPMAPVQIPLVLEPVPIPDVLESVPIPLVPPVPISDVLEPVPIPDVPPVHIPQPPVQIPVSHIPEPPVQISDVLEPPVQIPDVLEPVQIPVIPEPPVQIPLVQIPEVPEPVQIPVSQVPQPPMQILPEPMNILPVSDSVQIPDDPEPVQIPVSHVPQPPMQILPEPMNILHVPVQIPVSHVPQPPMQVLHVPVQIPVSHVPQSPVQSLPEPMQLLPELDMLDPLESTDAFDQLMSFVFGPQELQLLHTVPSIFDENLFSFLDEREPMDLTMPRVNSCVKNIAFKPIQPMDLFVNSSIGQ
ncbi:uncharacterized protein TNCV_250941 [Trichonephila clavipes]|nr:uncharacterized protein TNCV_250941 [Trichonephila clavipes]